MSPPNLPPREIVEIGARTVAGTTGLTFPMWADTVQWATGINTLVVSVLGLVVLGLTVRKLWLDVKFHPGNRREK